MKNIFYILLLLPTIIFAQYPNNSGQKITLGEQTTADGLVYRGVANDTNVITPFSDTSAYIILDTVNSKFYHYNRTTTYWALAGGGVSVSSFSAGTTGLTPSTATTGAVTLGGTLAVANGGTNAGEFNAGSVVFAGASGTYTQDNANLFWDDSNNRLGIGTSTPSYKLHIKPTSSGRTSHDQRMLMTIESSLEAYYNVNIPSNGYGGFRIHTTPTLDNDATFEYWAPTKKFHFSSSGYYGFNAKDNIERFRIDSTGNIGIGVEGPTARLHVKGSTNASEFALKVDDSGGTNLLSVKNNGNVGIGTTSPAALLDVRSTMRVSGDGINFGSSVNDVTLSSIVYTNGTGGIDVKSYAKLGLYAGGSERIHITSDGNVGIGADGSAGYKLDVNGTGRFSGGDAIYPTLKIQAPIYPLIDLIVDNADTNARNWRLAGVYSAYGTFEIVSSTTQGGLPTTPRFSINGVTGAVTIANLATGTVTSSSGTLSATSDMNLKISDGYIDNALDKIMNLKPRYFYWKEETGLPTNIRQLGFYAQEVNQSLGEEAANTPKNENDKWGIYDRSIIAMLTKAMQEQQSQIDILKQEIINLKNK